MCTQPTCSRIAAAMLGKSSSGPTSSEVTERGDLRGSRRPNPPIGGRITARCAYRVPRRVREEFPAGAQRSAGDAGDWLFAHR